MICRDRERGRAMADTGNERTGDEELRRRQAEILDEMMRLLRADAQVMETIRDMVGVAGEEAARRPAVFFQPPRGEEGGEGEIIGGQGISLGSVFGQLLDLVKSEKEFIQRIILRILGL
jgi:hypothetical protein